MLEPYNYAWYTIGGMPTTDTASGLCADFYSVEVTDFNGCIDTLDVEVTEPVTVTAFAVDSTATTCHGGSDGWAVVGGLGVQSHMIIGGTMILIKLVILLLV